MNTHLKDEIFAVISDDLAKTPQRPPAERPTRRNRTVLSVAAAGLLVAGVVAVASIDDEAGSVKVTPAQDTSTAAAAAAPTTTIPYDVVPERGFTLAGDHGTVWRVPSGWANDLMHPAVPPPPDPLRIAFRLASSDARLSGMTVSPANGPTGMATKPVGKIGDREVRGLANAGYPQNMTEATATGPWSWTEADGTEWWATGLLDDLRIALPDVRYEGGHMLPGSTLVPWVPETSATPELLRERDTTFELTMTADTATDLTIADPGAGRYTLVDINGAPGAFTSGGLQWRVDPSTVLQLSRSLNAGFTPGPTNDDLLAAARLVRPAGHFELASLPVWRGAEVERVVVFTPADLDLSVKVKEVSPELQESMNVPQGTVINVQPSVEVADLDGTALTGFTPDRSWADLGHVLPLGADKIGHQLRLRLSPTGESGPDGKIPDLPCTQTITVPPEGAPPVEVHLEPC